MHRIPNILSTARLILAPVFLILFMQDEFIWKVIGLALFAIAALTDYFDGFLARKYSSQSKIGAFLDPLADKFLTFSGFIYLALLDPLQFPWWAVIIIIIRDVFITGFRIYTDKKKQPMVTRFTAKAKTMAQMIFLYFVLTLALFIHTEIFLGVWARAILSSGILYYFMLFVTFITIYSGIEYLYVNRKVFQST